MVGVVALDVTAGLTRAQQRHATTGHNAFFHRRARGVQRVFDAGFLFLHLDFGGSANLDHRHTTGQLGHALLQLFAVIVAGGFFDLHANLLDAGFDVSGSTGAVDDDGVFLADFDPFGLAQVGQRDFFQRQAHFFGDDLAAGQDGDVFQHGLAAVAKARGFDRHHFEDAANGVDHQRGERFAFDVFGNDQQRTTGLGHPFQRRQQVADVADFLVEQQHEGVVQQRGLFFRVVDEVGREVAAVELHAFDDVELVVQALAVFDRDDAFFADLVHRVGNDVADRVVAVGRDRSDLGDFFRSGGGFGGFLEFSNQGDDGLVDAALQVHRVHAGGHVFHAFAHDGLCQHGGGGGAVTGVVAGLGSDFLDHLRAHVLQLVFQLDLFGHRDTVLGDGGSAEGALEHHVATFGAERDFDRVGQDVHAFDHAGAGFAAENYVFCCHVYFS